MQARSGSQDLRALSQGCRRSIALVGCLAIVAGAPQALAAAPDRSAPAASEPATSGAAGTSTASGPTALSVRRTDAARDCPTSEALAAMVNEVSQRTSVVAAAQATQGIAVELDRRGEEYRARILASAPVAGVRVISDNGPSCAGLSRAVAVTLALLLDPTASDRAASAERSDERDAASSSGLHAVPPRPVPESSPNLAPELGGAAAMGITFDATPALWIGATGTLPWWSAHLGVLWLPDSRRIVNGVPLRLGVWGGRSRVCRLLWRERSPWPRGAGCVDVVIGEFYARARQVENPTPARTLWVGGGGGVALVGPVVGRLSWRFDAAALAPFVDERFEVRGVGRVHDPPPVAGLFGLSVDLTIW